MAVKDFEDYYNQEELQYLEMLEEAKDLEDAYRAGEISEESYEQAIKNIEVVKINHQRLSYVMFLLKKRKKYTKKYSVAKEELSENASAISELKSIRKD